MLLLLIAFWRRVWYSKNTPTARSTPRRGMEVCQMKTLLKLFAVLAVAATVLALAAALFGKRQPETADYITLYGGPDETDA